GDLVSEKCHRCGGSGEEPKLKGLGRRVRAGRLRRGISLREAAECIGATESYLSYLECGNRSWSGPKARRYLKLLGISPGAAE
ncbi:hypothetical protein LCGC14_2388680, partial [marine sediment metagenome]